MTIWRWPNPVMQWQIRDKALNGCNIIVRVDASIRIGLGHFMRCLALMDAARARGATTVFVTRDLPVSCREILIAKGHRHAAIETVASTSTDIDRRVDAHDHFDWLPVSQQKDAAHTISKIADLSCDWLIVDHYGIDAEWEQALVPYCKKLMAIDDLADRDHFCDLLLDQNLGRQLGAYTPHLLRGCETLIGPDYALLRPEFAVRRAQNLPPRDARRPKHLLVALGGTDNDNVTAAVLRAFLVANLPSDTAIHIVMGAQAPWIEDVQAKARLFAGRAHVHIGIDTMAELIAECDLAIGAAGLSAWERCCLGLPSLLLIMAENQRAGAHALHAAGAAIMLESVDAIPHWVEKLFTKSETSPTLLQMREAALRIVDGKGVDRVLDRIFQNANR
jgi:UDP-2,4-diacetamido-2,4,6-trideoxy-beta-L-altropyranose hydrolase